MALIVLILGNPLLSGLRISRYLLENAIRYSPELGEIIVSLTAVNAGNKEIGERLVGRSRFHRLKSGPTVRHLFQDIRK